MTHEEILQTEITLSIVRGTRRITHRQHEIGNHYYVALQGYKKAYDGAYANAKELMLSDMTDRWKRLCVEYSMLQDGTRL